MDFTWLFSPFQDFVVEIVKYQVDLVEYLVVHQGVVSLVFRNLLVVNARMAFL